MEIKIQSVPGQRFKGELIIDGKIIETTVQARPGCCARNLINKMFMMHGKPSDDLVLSIDGW